MNTQPEDRPLADLVADLMQPLMAYAALLEKAGNPSQSGNSAALNSNSLIFCSICRILLLFSCRLIRNTRGLFISANASIIF